MEELRDLVNFEYMSYEEMLEDIEMTKGDVEFINKEAARKSKRLKMLVNWGDSEITLTFSIIKKKSGNESYKVKGISEKVLVTQ